MRQIIVIGAGIIGASVAERLSAAGARVTVLEAARPAAGTTSRSFAWVNALRKPPLPYHALNAAGLAEHHRLLATLPGSGFHPTGNLIWATDEAARARLRANVAQLQGWDYRAGLIDRAAAADLAPDLTLPPDGAADYAFAPDEGWVATATLVRRLLAAAEARGATVRWPAPVARLLMEGDRAVGVVCEGAEMRAEAVVDCTGRAGGDLLAPLGLTVTRRRSPGLLVLTEPAPLRLERVVHTPGVYLRPDGGGRLVIGSDEIDAGLADLPADATHLERDAAPARELLRRAQAIAPWLAGVGIEAARIGWRALPEDDVSAVGPVPGLGGYYLVLTHSGVTLGPLLGRLAASEVLHDEPQPQLGPFRPDRLIRPTGN